MAVATGEYKQQGDEATSHGSAEDGPASASSKGEGHPACLNVEAYKDFTGRLEACTKEVWGENGNYWCKSAFSGLQTQSFQTHDEMQI